MTKPTTTRTRRSSEGTMFSPEALIYIKQVSDIVKPQKPITAAMFNSVCLAYYEFGLSPQQAADLIAMTQEGLQKCSLPKH